MNANSTKKWIFDTINHEATVYNRLLDFTWYPESSMPVGSFAYKGIHFLGGNSIKSTDNYQTFTWNGDIYTKVVE